MTQQMGSASGTAPVSRANEAAPGGASEVTSESMTNGEASGGAPGVTEADGPEPVSAEPAGPGPAGLAVSADGTGSAGHDVPYVRTQAGVQELRGRGMPLGLMPGMPYEEMRFQFEPRATRPSCRRWC